ncbi:class III lanthionine synthetase LanKC [Streptacidiphilus anmyonensis]|uniref:class III lanthionine synthetase LanKC n=1 Tax=Streptacidiphilus anmyonensis TaxID=405782 RepID=UPI0005AA6DF9|nr:class III lanthionine synthetase LanKC [Streptacidiphilus anmyonensis]
MADTASEFAVADREFYAPLAATAAPRGPLTPSRTAAGWRATTSGIWVMWHRDGLLVPKDGWKVHVSARRSRLAPVLDTVAGICFAHDVAFKHIASDEFYWWVHHKHASRAQSGKFIAVYPPGPAAARRLMEDLCAALDGESGPYILSDRRYRPSAPVSYRYGAFAPRERLEADGTGTPLVLDGHGRAVPDRRDIAFRLPSGVTDPFVGPRANRASATADTSLHGFAVGAAVRHSNGGGAYLGREVATGRKVFIKEARPHHGLGEGERDAVAQLDGEWRTLTALQAAAPGLAPEPIARFRVWEHEFLVTEFIEGIALNKLVATTHPLIIAGSAPEDFDAYYARCERVLTAIEEALARLHALGYVFVDVSPGNVLVAPDDTVRLVDFEAARGPGVEPTLLGTPGYSPPADLVERHGPTVYDDYGVSALTQLLVGPLHHTVARHAAALRHLHRDVTEQAPLPSTLWQRVVRHHALDDAPELPSPQEVAEDPLRHLSALRDAVADALEAMADPDHPDRVFPSVPRGYRTNTVCVAYGTAGVVHALTRAGRALPGGVLDRLRREATDAADRIGPGLYVGSAGLAWVLADQGLLDEAEHLLAKADRHPLTEASATLFGGAAGVALGHLALHRHTGDERHLDRARALLTALPVGDALTPRLGDNDATGLLHGRCGVALALQQLATVTGEDEHLHRAVALLHAELDRAIDPLAPGLVFPVSDTDRRAMPYLYCGSAGLVHVASRCLRAAPDARLTAAMPRLLAPLRGTFTVMPSLFPGMGGLAFVLAEHARLTGDATSHTASLRAAQALFKHAVPHPTGVRFLGEGLLRYSAELWSGSAGVLLALDQVLTPRADRLFTLDTPDPEPATSTPPPSHAGVPR